MTSDLDDSGSPTERMRIDSGGGVNIGVDGPSATYMGNSSADDSAKVRVLGDTILKSSGTVPLILMGSGTSADVNLQFYQQDNLRAWIKHIDSTHDQEFAVNAGDFIFKTHASGGTVTEKFRIMGSGNVGIGTAAPKGRMWVTDGSLSTTDPVVGSAVLALFASADDAMNAGVAGQLMVQSTDAQAVDKGGMITFGGERADNSSGALPFAAIKGAKENSTSGNYATYLAFGTRAHGANITEKMRINSSGNVIFTGTLNSGAITSTAGISGTTGTFSTNVIVNNSAPQNNTNYLQVKSYSNDNLLVTHGDAQGRIGFGVAVSGTTLYNFGGTMSHRWTGGGGVGMYINIAHQPSSSQWVYGNVLAIKGAITVPASSANPWHIGTMMEAPSITSGSGTVTNSATLRITGAMSHATYDYSLYIDSGNTYFGTGAAAFGGTVNAASTFLCEAAANQYMYQINNYSDSVLIYNSTHQIGFNAAGVKISGATTEFTGNVKLGAAKQYQIVNGSKTCTQGAWTEIAFVDHTHVLEVMAWATTGGNRNRMVIYDIITSYGSAVVSVRRVSGAYGPSTPTVDDLQVAYLNSGGSEAYILRVYLETSDNSTNASVYWTIRGMSDSAIRNK
jgi:hypothetical protein